MFYQFLLPSDQQFEANMDPALDRAVDRLLTLLEGDPLLLRIERL